MEKNSNRQLKNMKPEQFVYWLQGFSEMNENQPHPTRKQWKMIEDHLKTVFKKETPSADLTATGWVTTSDPMPLNNGDIIC
jgi:hypothetical protein